MKRINRLATRLFLSTTKRSSAKYSMNLTLEEISQAVNGTLDGGGATKVRGYSIDSRTINAGELFLAIKGPNFDGHAFVAQVLEKKVAAAVVDQAWQPSATLSGPVIRV